MLPTAVHNRYASRYNIGDKKAMLSLDAFREAAKRHTDAARVWLKILENIASNELTSMFNRLPQERISEPAINFALEVLKINRNRLLELLEELY
ncbi:MAG: hypothetical protein Fur0025_40410 [Oscillatoriaceae cyanobacterium]